LKHGDNGRDRGCSHQPQRAGDESYFDFKLALLDRTNWLDPTMTHWHHTHALGGVPRGYPQHYSDDYYRNLMTCALVIGGEKWLNKVYSNFRTQPRLGSTTMFELYEDAIASGEEHAKYLAALLSGENSAASVEAL